MRKDKFMSRTVQLIHEEVEIEKTSGYFIGVETSPSEKRISRSTINEDKENLKITLVFESLTPG